MEMRNENDLQFFRLQSSDSALLCRCRTPHYSRPAVNQIGPVIHHHRDRRSPTIRIRAWIPRTQHDHASSRHDQIVQETVLCQPTGASGTCDERYQYEKVFIQSKSPGFDLGLDFGLALTPVEFRPPLYLREETEFFKAFNRESAPLVTLPPDPV
jgi:hypothetical protein